MLPLAGSLIDIAQNWPTDVSVITNSDVLFTQSVPDAIAKIRTQFTDWFMTGARYGQELQPWVWLHCVHRSACGATACSYDIQDLPPIYEPGRPDFNEAAFSGFVRTKGTLHTAGGLVRAVPCPCDG
jgi:hypothetical protein